MTFAIFICIFTSAVAQLSTEEMQTFQNAHVQSYMRSETLMNVCIIVFISLVVLVVLAVLIRSFINKRRATQMHADQDKEKEIVARVQNELMQQNATVSRRRPNHIGIVQEASNEEESLEDDEEQKQYSMVHDITVDQFH